MKTKIKTLKKAVKVASSIYKNKEAITKVFNDSEAKASAKKSKLPSGLLENLRTFMKMMKAYFTGSFKPTTKTVIYLVAGLLYFVNPFDLIPDFILAFGFLDDAIVLSKIAEIIKNELERFKLEAEYQEVEVIL